MGEVDLEELNLLKDSNSKYCKNCAAVIPKEAVICVKCGCQVEELKSSQQQVVINNNNSNVNNNNNNNINKYGARYGKAKNKWVAFLLCLFAGFFGVHKFYEEKVGIGIVYFFTAGLFGIGWIIDCIALLLKPNPYYI